MSIEKNNNSVFTDRLLSLVEKQTGGNATLFAQQAGITQATFHNYTKGRLPNFAALYNICSYFNVNLNWLITGEGSIYIDRAAKREGGGPVDEDPEIAELLEGARRVLKSGNPIAFDALERNIRYFDHAVATEKRLQQTEAKMESVSQEMTEIKALLKERLKCGTDTDEERRQKSNSGFPQPKNVPG